MNDSIIPYPPEKLEEIKEKLNNYEKITRKGNSNLYVTKDGKGFVFLFEQANRITISKSAMKDLSIKSYLEKIVRSED